MKRILFLAVCVVFLSSCIPAKYAITPGVNGMIIDKETHVPIPQATIYLENKPELSTKTNTEGYFKLASIEEWQWFMIMGVGVDHMPPSDCLIVNAAGYQPVKTDRVHRSSGDRLVWLNIELEKIKNHKSLTNGSIGSPKKLAPGEP
jgi:hypothetical protein